MIRLLCCNRASCKRPRRRRTAFFPSPPSWDDFLDLLENGRTLRRIYRLDRDKDLDRRQKRIEKIRGGMPRPPPPVLLARKRANVLARAPVFVHPIGSTSTTLGSRRRAGIRIAQSAFSRSA